MYLKFQKRKCIAEVTLEILSKYLEKFFKKKCPAVYSLDFKLCSTQASSIDKILLTISFLYPYSTCSRREVF